MAEQKSFGLKTARFLKYVWLFFSIILKGLSGSIPKIGLTWYVVENSNHPLKCKDNSFLT